MIEIIRLKETSQTAMVTGCKRKNSDNLRNRYPKPAGISERREKEYLNEKKKKLDFNEE
jgi:hypothetical protein